MKTLTKEVLGFDVPITGVAEDLHELLLLAGGGNAEQNETEQAAARKAGEEKVFAAAVNYIHFHSHYSKVRSKIIDTLIEKTGKKMETDKDGKITEKDLEYVGRIEEESGGAGSLEAYASDVSTAIAALPVDYTQTSRAEGGKIGKEFLAYYDKLVEDGKLEKFIEKHGLEVEGLNEESKKLVVASKIKELVTAAKRAAMAAIA